MGESLARFIPGRWRWAHRWYAESHGYFWLPCPLCGRMTGGHEWRHIDGKPSTIPGDEPGTGRGICPWCTRAGRGSWGMGLTQVICFCEPCIRWRKRHPEKGKCDV